MLFLINCLNQGGGSCFKLADIPKNKTKSPVKINPKPYAGFKYKVRIQLTKIINNKTNDKHLAVLLGKIELAIFD